MGQFWKTPRNQDGIGWCYGYAAADLLSETIGEPVSAAYVSYNYNESASWNFSWIWRHTGVPESAQQIVESGFVGDAIKRTKSAGICLEKALPSESQHAVIAHIALKQAMQDLVELRGLIENKKLKRREFVDCIECKNKIEDNYGLKTFFPKLKAEELYDVIQANSSSSINAMIHSLSQRYCESTKKKFPTNRKVKTHRTLFNKKADLFDIIDRQLSQKKPISFSTPIGLIDESREGQHAMTIIGRAKRGGQCKYLVRNSWGRGCAYYQVKEVQDDCIPEQGAMWISKKRLSQYMEEITYVD